MMTVVGMLRVKNEERWIRRAVRSILPICNKVVVFDDHSTDGTPQIAREALGNMGLVIESKQSGLDEVRDKNYLLALCCDLKPDWIISIDGDEVLQNVRAEVNLSVAMQATKASALAFPILYLWDREDQVRCDGVYGTMSRVSAFRPGAERFQSTGGVNFHCGNAPQGIRGRELVNAPLLHYGYRDQADRIRKYAWYNEKDPNNQAEDCYRHIVQGDVPEVPADAKLKHAGPLRFRSL